ncbi:hypothetical protein ScPMuIL_002352 [Solemya velum]
MKTGFLAPILICALYFNLVFGNRTECAKKRANCLKACVSSPFPGCKESCEENYNRCIRVGQKKRPTGRKKKNWRRAAIIFGFEALQTAMRRFQVIIDS